MEALGVYDWDSLKRMQPGRKGKVGDAVFIIFLNNQNWWKLRLVSACFLLMMSDHFESWRGLGDFILIVWFGWVSLIGFMEKKAVIPVTHIEMIRQYPITGLVEGWYFRAKEVSQGCFVVEASDFDGRKISRQSTRDVDAAMAECIEFAKNINHNV